MDIFDCRFDARGETRIGIHPDRFGRVNVLVCRDSSISIECIDIGLSKSVLNLISQIGRAVVGVTDVNRSPVTGYLMARSASKAYTETWAQEMVDAVFRKLPVHVAHAPSLGKRAGAVVSPARSTWVSIWKSPDTARIPL